MAVELKTSRWCRARSTAATAAETALATTVATLSNLTTDVEGYRGGRIRFYSNGADDDTATFTMYDVNMDIQNGHQAQSLGTIAITLGTSTAVAGTIAADPNMAPTIRWADTMVWTATTYGTAMLTRVGGNIAAFNPADNTIAELLVSDFGAAMYIALVCTTHGPTDGLGIMPVVKLEV